MTNYGYDTEETHENMHIHRRERHYSGHKLAVAVGHNKLLRTQAGKEKIKESKSKKR